jgi:hypothetical protein
MGRFQWPAADLLYAAVVRKPGPVLRRIRDEPGAFKAVLRDALPVWREHYRAGQLVHLCASGDFTLLARDEWCRLRGYLEFDGYPWHVDSILLYAALARGIKQVALPPSHRVFHIAHSKGSGWTPEGGPTLFARLAEKQIPYLNDDDLWRYARELQDDPDRKPLNGEGWGLGDYDLGETTIS